MQKNKCVMLIAMGFTMKLWYIMSHYIISIFIILTYYRHRHKHMHTKTKNPYAEELRLVGVTSFQKCKLVFT